MSIALSEFWTRLVRSGITDAVGCKQLAASFSTAHGGTPPSDAATLAKFMIKAGELTEFQARALLADQPQPLRLADYLLRSDAPPPLSKWAEATRLGDGQSGVLFRASAQQLSGGRTQWLVAHAAIAKPTLQGFASEAEATSTLVFSPLPSGRSLRDMIGERGSLSPKETCQIGIDVADALEALHARPLIHGSVHPNRVWMTESGEAILLRDPSGPPQTPIDQARSAASGDQMAWLDPLDAPQAYAAPEFANDEQVCNQSTDLYALGCLLFRLAAGRDPYEGNSIPETVAAHASETPPELAAAIEQGESGDPLYRVIAFAMAKNPAARFATAPQLAGALRATLPLLPEVPVSKQGPSKKPQTKTGRSSSPTEKSIEKPAAKRAESVKATDKSSAPAEGQSKPAPEPEPTVKPKRTPEPKPTVAKPAPVKSKSTVQPKPATPKPKTSPAPPPSESPAVQSTPVSETKVTVAAGNESAQAASPPPVAADSGAETSPSRPLRRRKKKKSNAPLFLGAMCVLVLMLLIGLIVHDPSPVEAKKRERPPIPDVIPSVSGGSVPTPTGDLPAVTDPVPVEGYELVDDERLLFVPPYAAQSPNAPLEMLPPGPAVIISARLAAIADSSLGSGLIESLSPELASVIELAAARSGVPIESIERCSVAMHPGKDGWPDVSLAIDLKEPRPSSELIEKWQVAASRTPEGATIYAGDAVDGDAYYFPAPENGSDSISRFAVGSVEQISEVAAAEGGATLLPRALQRLWDGSSDQADLVVLITPNFLFADGRSLLQSSVPELVRPLKSVLIPDVSGALVTAHVVDEQLYVETRFAPSGGVSEPALMRSLRDAIQAWPSWADEFIVESVPDSSWRLLASRLPSMMRFVVDQTRFGISGGSVVANMYLPKQAVPQVTLATLLAMNTSAGGSALAIVPPTQPLTVDEMLARKMSVSFDQESLEFAIDAIVGDYKRTLPAGSTLPSVKIIGSDLQTMGITQNQQVRNFTKTDLPLRTVLTDLVLGANPDKSATGAKDPKQALIWVLADDPENPGEKAILVTTRQAAENKYDLPEEFRLDP